MTLDRDVLTTALRMFPHMRKMTLGKTTPSLFFSIQAKRVVNEQQLRVFMDGWDPLFVCYLAAAYFHSRKIRTNSWTDEARIMRVSMPPIFDASEVRSILDKAGLENMDPVYKDGLVIVVEGRIIVKDLK